MTGKITAAEQDYGISDEFRHLSRAIGTVLDLDEVEAGKLLVEGGSNSGPQDQFLVVDAVSRYHDRRDLLLQTLRITLQESLNFDRDDGVRSLFQDVVVQILDVKTGPPSNGSAFTLKCLKAMEDIENWIGKVNDQIQTRAILSQARGPEFYATLDFQKSSLFKQHEALAAIVTLLFRGNYTISEDLRKVHAVVKRWQRLDLIWVHYLPIFSAAFGQYGSPEHNTSAADAKSLNSALTASTPDRAASQARPLLAILDLWWTAEYCGWFREPISHDAEEKKRMEFVKTALEDHALEFLLLLCSGMNLEMWRHPSRQELVEILIGDRSSLVMDLEQQSSSFFYTLFMESIEAFAEAWITNMPDSIRRLKNEEDDQRLLQVTAGQDGMISSAQRDHVGRMHLESFLVIMAFAFEHRPDASEQFWEDRDGNLYGFVQWASKRQTVPRVSAFCELMCAISEGARNAENAHQFLLDESIAAPTSRTRRVPTMNYQQIFAELELYARKVHEKRPVSQVPGQQRFEMNEVESPVMLSCYLRLIAHLCRHHVATRQYIFGLATMSLPQILLQLSSGPVPSYLRANVFRTLEALLTNKDSTISNEMWKTIDTWASSTHDVAAVAQAKPNQPVPLSLWDLQVTLSSISQSYDQYDAFVDLLRSLISPTPSTILDGQPLPFPPDLGSSYRNAGINPYVDFVCGQLFVKRIRELGDETQACLCSFHCLDFVALGLEGFNEGYVTMLNKSPGSGDNSGEQNPAQVYAQRHPFARMMQWLFSVEMNKLVLNLLHGRLDDVEVALPDAPVVLNLLRCIDVINMVLDLQPTYFDIVRPMVKDSESSRGINSAGVGSFEESIVGHVEIILDLCQYAATNHLQLSLRSLALLQKLTSSPRLNNNFGPSSRGKTSRLIDMIGPNVDVALQPVATTLASRMQIDIRELEDSFEASGYLMKDGILAFLNACLGVEIELPNIAHLLLGFGRIGERLTITPSIDNGVSLMNTIMDLVLGYPDGQGGEFSSWLVHLKSAGMRALQHLWTSPVSAVIVLGQLRRFGFLAAQFAGQTTVSQSTVWDGNSILDPSFWYTTSAEALIEFLTMRACLYDYATKELASLTSVGQGNNQKQVISTLQGKSIVPDGSVQSHLNIFDLFDFADLDLSAALQFQDLNFFADINFESFMNEATDTVPELYNISMIRELLQMRHGQILDVVTQSSGGKAADEEALIVESDVVISRLEARNRWTLAQKARSETLHAYVSMVIAASESSAMEAGTKPQFVLQVLQVILPKLDTFVAEESREALELARAADSLLMILAKSSSTPTQSRIDSIIAERLFQVFRICIEGIPLAGTGLELRALLYSICSQYLTRITAPDHAALDQYKKACRSSMDCVRSASQRLIGVLADDAEDGSDNCRTHALSLLSLLIALARGQNSTLVIDSLVKANIIEIMFEPIRNITMDFSATSAKREFTFCP